MKHLHFDVEPNGFYGAYWAFPAAGNYPKEYRQARIDIEKRMCLCVAEWKGGCTVWNKPFTAS